MIDASGVSLVLTPDTITGFTATTVDISFTASAEFINGDKVYLQFPAGVTVINGAPVTIDADSDSVNDGTTAIIGSRYEYIFTTATTQASTTGVSFRLTITSPPGNQGVSMICRGSIGDFGGSILYVGSANQVGISASVGPQDSGGPTDTNPPICSNITITDITYDSATITWQTDEPSTSVVDYGLTNAYELGSVSDANLVTDHSITLTGLDSDTLYYIAVRSTDGSNNAKLCGELTFSTLGTPLLYIRVIPEKRLPSIGNNQTVLRLFVFQRGTSDIVVDETVVTDVHGFNRDIFFIEHTQLPKQYDFKMKGFSHLTKRHNQIWLNETLDLVDFSAGVTVFLLAGDTNGITGDIDNDGEFDDVIVRGDDKVNGMDLGQIANHIYTKNYRCDLNQDKFVNGLDFAIAVTNINRLGDL